MTNTKVLIVEDEGIEALDIQQRLINLGYMPPDIAFSGEEAVGMAKESYYDLVLMDIMMHGEIDGIIAAEKIRKICNAPVIFLTAYADEKTVQRAKITGPYGYIVKPFRERELDIAIEMALYKKNMEKKLKESEEWLSITLKSIGDAVIATDDKGRITFMNTVAENLTGWSMEEAYNKYLTEVFKIINKSTRKPVENPAERVIQTGCVVGLANHTLLITKDGNETPVDDSAAPIKDDRGNIIGVILVFRDVTEREIAEAKLRESYEELERRVTERTADLEATNNQLKKEVAKRGFAECSLQEKNIELENACLTKDRFLANMSHELRTPLNAIIGFTGTLLMKLPGPLNPEQENQLHNISISANHLLLLINDLLDLSKIESGKVELNPEPVSCKSIIDYITESLRPIACKKNIKLIKSVPEEDIIIHTDRRTISQIMLNLTSNAIKFTEDGEVWLNFGSKINSGVTEICFSVTDTWVGIKAEDQTKLFREFTQVDTPSARRHEGTGLGLYLCKKFAELLGGHIEFQSEFGKGSTFSLIIGEAYRGIV